MRALILAVILSFVLSAFSNAQKTIQGVVTELSTGLTLPGVNISIKGTTVGTVTNFDGEYTIEVPDDETILLYSFIGMTAVEEAVKGRSNINVAMAENSQKIEDVMVVAYGTTTKEAFTGAAEVVDNKIIEDRPVTSFEKSLQGTTAGLQVTASSGQPGASATVRIRGIGSFGGSAPLYIIDGVPMSGALSDINPNDIESLTVLKDAAASSLYGSRAANGVIMITTKKGKKGKTQISFNAQSGISTRVSDGYALMNSTQIYEQTWRGLYNQAIIHDGKTNAEAIDIAHDKVEGIVGFNPFSSDNPLDDSGQLISGTNVLTNTDWRDQVYKTGITQNYNLSISSGNQDTQLFFSFGYFSDSGTTIGANFERFTNKINVSQKVTSFLTAGMSTHLSHSKVNAPPSGSENANPVRSAEAINAASPVKNADGTYNWDNLAVFDFNPVALSHMDKYEYKTNRGLINAFLDFQILPSLSFRTTGSIDYSQNKGLNHYNPNHGNGAGVKGRSTQSVADNTAWNISNILRYNKSNERSNFEALLGYEAHGEKYEGLSAGVTGFSVPNRHELMWGSSPEMPSSSSTEWNMISYLSQVKYSLAGKYYLSASLRSDGNSRFGENYKYGVFYSFGGGWRISEEDWMPELSWLNNLKLRASYGTSGNSSIGNYASLGLYAGGANYGGYSGLAAAQLANTELHWEKITAFNIGLESRFFNRVDASFEYYQRDSDGLLFAKPLSASKGFGSITTNLGAMVNTGFEATLSVDLIKDKPYSNTLGFNISTNTNEILNIESDQIISGTKLIEPGADLYQFYMREWAGVNPENGMPMWFTNTASDDVTNNEELTSAYLDPLGTGRQVTSDYGDAERIRQGSALPDFFGGINNNFAYKGFDFSFYFYFSVGNKVYNYDYAGGMHDGVQPSSNLAADAANAWTPNNRYTDVPRYIVNNQDQGNQMSSRFLEDASYLRLKNISLSYTLPKTLSTRVKVNNAKVFVSAENIWTLSKYKGFDPEGAINGTTNNVIPGVKVISFGIKLDL